MQTYIMSGLVTIGCLINLFAIANLTAADALTSTRLSDDLTDAPGAEIREFEVRVDNKPVGSHRLVIQSDGVNQRVRIQTDVKVDFVVYAYIFKFRGTEHWRDGHLEATSIQCEDGGSKRSFQLKTDGDIQKVSLNGKPVNDPQSSVMTTAYWKLPAAELRSKPLPIVDVDSAKFHKASINLLGQTTLATEGRSLKCQHVKIDGPSPAELWFDEQDCLVRQRSVERGHTMELRLKQIRIAKDER